LKKRFGKICNSSALFTALIPNLHQTICIFCKKNQKIPQTGNKKLQLLRDECTGYLSIRDGLIVLLVLDCKTKFHQTKNKKS
jgi:hypothetical protein